MKYYAYVTKIGRSILNRILIGQEKIQLKLALKNGFKSLIPNLSNIFYLPNSSYNLLSLRFLNNSSIYYDNKNEIFYKIYIKQILAYTQH